MSTATETMTTSATNIKAEKKTKQTQKKLITLRLSPPLLAQFLPKPLSRSDSTIKSDPDSAPTPNIAANGDGPTNGTPADNVSESNSTPAPNDDNASGTPDKKKGGPGSKGGVKRSLGEGASRPRGRPGPKKRPRLDEEAGVRTSFGGAVPLATHKLGPKANQGAINAGLRALDRSGKACRKWERKPFVLKSFTGVTWEIPSWKAPPQQELTNGEADGSSTAADSENKQIASSTGLPSEKSNQGEQSERPDPMALSTPAASSPPPAPPAIIVESEA